MCVINVLSAYDFPLEPVIEKKVNFFPVNLLLNLVGAIGFEPTTPSPPVKCATRLRHAPNFDILIKLLTISTNLVVQNLKAIENFDV